MAMAIQELTEFNEIKARVQKLEGRVNEHHGTVSYLKGIAKMVLTKLKIDPNHAPKEGDDSSGDKV